MEQTDADRSRRSKRPRLNVLALGERTECIYEPKAAAGDEASKGERQTK